MTRGRKQKAAKDLWALAGGFSVVMKEFSKLNAGHTIPYNSEIWTNLSLSIFGNDNKQYKHWLWVIWHDNRRGLKDQVLLSRKPKRSQPLDPGLKRSDTEEKLHGDTNMTKERPTESGTLCTSQDSTHSNSQLHVSEDDVDDTSWESADDIEKPLLQENDTDKTNINKAAQCCAADQEPVGTAELVSEESAIHTASIELSEMVTDFAKERTDSENVSVTVKDAFDSLVTAKENVEKDSQPQRNPKKIRKVCSVPKTFKISLNKKKWRAIKLKIGSVQLRKPWTHVIYEAFNKVNPNCVLAFKYQHVRLMNSRKRNSAFANIRAVCTFPTCKAQYIFLMKRKPTNMQRKVFMTVYRRGQICHLKEHTRKRQASNVRRGKIAKVIHKGVSQVYYSKLRRTPVEEIMAGNLTRSLNRDILKVISSEVKKAASLHDNVLLEMHLTQRIMKECDTSYRHLPGYIQNFQVDPFSCHMYTEKGISILVTHMRKKSLVTLYLDATGNVVSKIPEQNKRVLYYALVLAGQGRGTPPLPIAEMLSNDHTVPSVSFWLMQFVHNLSKFTTLTIRYLETDYSWALIQAALLAFNKESILSYLDRCFDVCQGKDDGMDSKSFTVIHICSAHVLKAVAQAICRHVTDKAHREFVIFVFARLQNSQTLDEAIRIFQALCIVLNTRTNTATVKKSVKALQGLIRCFILDKDMPENRVQMNTADEKDEQSRTIVGRSRFSAVFRRAFDEATKSVTEEEESSEENLYYSPSIIQTLFNTYMAIFPMWSGVMLGDLKRHAADKDITSLEDGGQRQDNKTRETNCHVEGWFTIVKQHILMKACRLRPGNFVREMYSSLQGRYIEHIMHHGFSLKLLQKPLNLKDIKFAEESWAKKEKLTASKMGESKFYSVPTSVPHPKWKQSRKAKRHVTTVVDQASEKKFEVSSNQKQDISTITVPEKNAKQQPTTTKLVEATSAPKKKQQRKPKKHDHTANESETQSKTFSFGKVDLDAAATLETTSLNVQEEPEQLWERKECEVVVAVQKMADNKTWMSLRQSDFITLKPHNLLNGETIEYYIHASMNKNASTKRLCILNHYTIGVILFGGKQQITRQSLRKENFEDYDGAVGFVNVHSNHWKFVFLHAMSEQIFVVDPADVSNDLKDSKLAATRFQQYFKTRFNLHGKRDWLNIKWKPSTIVHTVQQDATSCGLFVVQMAREVIETFPAIPDAFNINPNQGNIKKLRRQMANDILHGSESKEEYCSYCGLKEAKSNINTLWIQCEQCQRWFHACCLELSPDIIHGQDAQWYCSMCH